MGSRNVARGALIAIALLATAAVVDPATSAAAGSERAKSRVAMGKTAQHRGIGARLYPKRLQMLDFNAILQCRDGSELIVEEGGFLPIRIRPNGSFADVQYGSTDTVRLRGRVGKRVVSGRLRVQDRWGKTRCDSRWFGFTARIRG